MSPQDRIVSAARTWIGTPYRHQASVRHVGCDCLGLVRGVWRDCFGPEPEVAPPYAASWAESAAPGTDPLAEAAARHLVPVSPRRGASRRCPAVLLPRPSAGPPLRHRHGNGAGDGTRHDDPRP